MGSRWDDDSVAVSRAALGARKQKTVGGGRDVFEVTFETQKKLKSFWNEHRVGFSKMWTDLSKEDRQKLLLTISPFMPQSESVPYAVDGTRVSGVVALIPEMNLKDLKVPDTLLELIARFAMADQEDTTYASMGFIAEQLNKRKLSPDPAEARSFWQPLGNNKFKKFDIKTREIPPELAAMIDRGHLLQSQVFTLAITRLHTMLTTLALVADEYLTTYHTGQNAYTTSAALWAPPGDSGTHA
eukprot:1195693-Prorocentrum_minimum.AAC.10